jgi:hypothetical protein
MLAPIGLAKQVTRLKISSASFFSALVPYKKENKTRDTKSSGLGSLNWQV